MITSVSLKNFKAWRELPEIRLAPITGLFGPNSAGKSSIVQLLLLLKQTAEHVDPAIVLDLGNERALVELGSFADLVYGRAAGERLGWSVAWDLPRRRPKDATVGRADPIAAAKSMRFEAEVAANDQGRILVDRFHYSTTGARCGMARQSNRAYALEVEPVDLIHQLRSDPSQGSASPVKCYGFPPELRAGYDNTSVLARLQQWFEALFSSVYYLGPLRERPQRQYAWSGQHPSDVGSGGEHTFAALLASRTAPSNGSPEMRPLEELVAEALRALGLIDSFRLAELGMGSGVYRVLVRQSSQTPEVALPDVGFGVSQVLPVLTLCYYVPEGSTIILEHPEMHLHPSVQSGLADALIDAVKTRGIQVIVESHSEHLLRRLQRRLAEEVIKPDDVALYFCEPRNGEAHIEPLALNQFGEIANWPEAFFGDEFEEISETQLAADRRRAAGR